MSQLVKVCPTGNSLIGFDDAVNHQLERYCDGSKFKKHVREAISDEMFLRNILQQYMITSLVKDELTREIPTRVKSEAHDVVLNLADTRLANFVSSNMPGHIANELNKQVPNYLNNNAQMQQILNAHSYYLNQQLTSLAAQTLDNLVNEPEYQIVAHAHLAAMQQKCENNLVEINNKHCLQLTNNDHQFHSQMNEMKNHYEHNLETLKQQLADVAVLNNKVTQLEEKNKWFSRGLLLYCSATFGLVGYFLTKN